MRTLLKFTSDITAGNTAIADGRLPAVIKDTMDRLKPEAAYFFAENGNRTGLLVFDLKDVSDIPSIAEPLFITLKAKVEFIPVMNADDLQKGLKTAVKTKYVTEQ
ncbi:hypothetical protein [Flavisolibacter tropicus]|uniref:Muconolactone isomerase domain-containing protein n=1 Tax=Flavisolibacter tropicus TaxID=1492898 RepID=A0A172TVD2_9BACT|nr:hypothetical protein [Flavisolibacter tropicus]ANE50743.1 hypothetical protein SY85_09780 [Flavisolibacter tropicus]